MGSKGETLAAHCSCYPNCMGRDNLYAKSPSSTQMKLSQAVGSGSGWGT